MSERISDAYIEAMLSYDAWTGTDVRLALRELQRSRALVAELRALAERMNEFDAERQWFGSSCAIEGIEDATTHWHSELTSLLAAHDAQHAEGRE